MRLNDIVNEDQINELNALKNIAGALRGARDGGIKGAVSGYKASKATNQGDAHAKRIVANLKSEFMRTVGGGHPATYDNLIKFLQARGLSKLETIPNPSVAPTATAPVTPETRIDPTLEDVNVGASLSNAQIDGIINNAVKINYSKIRQAQQGIFEPDDEQPAVDDPATPEEPAASQPVNKTKWTPNEADMKNVASWADAVESGSQKMDDVPEVYKDLVDQELAQRGVAKGTGAPTPPEPTSTSATPAPESPATPTAPQQPTEPQVQPTSDFVKLKKSYEILSPQEREKLKQEFEIIDDHDRLATGTNESKKLKSNKTVLEFHSKFLGTII